MLAQSVFPRDLTFSFDRGVIVLLCVLAVLAGVAALVWVGLWLIARDRRRGGRGAGKAPGTRPGSVPPPLARSGDNNGPP